MISRSVAGCAVRRVVLAVSCLALWAVRPPVAAAQDAEEFQLWLWAGLDAELVDDLKLEWEQHVRLRDDLRDFRYQNQTGLQYRLLDWMKVSVAHRLTYDPYRNDPAARCCRNRIQGDLGLGDKLGKIEPDARLRFQSRFDKGEDPVNVFRLRLGLTLRVWKKIRPFVTVEGFVNVLEPGPPTPRKLRATFGSDFRPKKRVRLRAYYRFEIPDDVTRPVRHIFGLGGTYRIKRRKKH